MRSLRDLNADQVLVLQRIVDRGDAGVRINEVEQSGDFPHLTLNALQRRGLVECIRDYKLAPDEAGQLAKVAIHGTLRYRATVKAIEISPTIEARK